ncbi:MAG: peptidoglycan-binding protein [Lachnospiraceae bacterium]|nr:peptidoglycan-binding protein [Butyrivibrio sp.]MCM1344005.1 peptidoglycan-binding protein [Muribaculaceae bacterium]MCM1411528.1 peptidoglycan-binding protein [Lachnospiraceae bacterium]
MDTVAMLSEEKKGIDVSDNQGVIDWGAARAAGVEFAILRSVRRSGKTDHQFDNNVKGCLKQGIPFDVYKYSYALTEDEARTEMRQVCSLLAEYGIYCRIWDDVEWADQRVLGKAAVTKIIKAAKDTVEGLGYPFGIYCNLDWYKNVIDTAAFEDDFWVARYPGKQIVQFGASPDKSKKPVTRQTLFGWQWSSTGRVDGIKGNVDLDVIYQGGEDQTEIRKNPYKEPAYTLYRGRLAMEREAVRWLQWHLVRLGYLDQTYFSQDINGRVVDSVDGIYGRRTDDAVYRFQLEHLSTYQGDVPDRKVGILTRAMLRAL